MQARNFRRDLRTGMNSSPCRKCGAQIVFLQSKSSTKKVPVDAATTKDGDWFYDPKAGHISHFATCSSPDFFRKK